MIGSIRLGTCLYQYCIDMNSWRSLVGQNVFAIIPRPRSHQKNPAAGEKLYKKGTFKIGTFFAYFPKFFLIPGG